MGDQMIHSNSPNIIVSSYDIIPSLHPTRSMEPVRQHMPPQNSLNGPVPPVHNPQVVATTPQNSLPMRAHTLASTLSNMNAHGIQPIAHRGQIEPVQVQVVNNVVERQRRQQQSPECQNLIDGLIANSFTTNAPPPTSVSTGSTLPSLTPTKKRDRRGYCLFTPEQKGEMLALLAKNLYPSVAERERIATKFGLSAKQISKWFEKRRHYAKRENIHARHSMGNSLVRPENALTLDSSDSDGLDDGDSSSKISSLVSTLLRTTHQSSGASSTSTHPAQRSIKLHTLPPEISSTPYPAWTIAQVGTWLCHIKLTRYAGTFEEHEIEGSHLDLLTDSYLKDLGFQKIGNILTFHRELTHLRKQLKESDES